MVYKAPIVTLCPFLTYIGRIKSNLDQIFKVMFQSYLYWFLEMGLPFTGYTHAVAYFGLRFELQSLE